MSGARRAIASRNAEAASVADNLRYVGLENGRTAIDSITSNVISPIAQSIAMPMAISVRSCRSNVASCSAALDSSPLLLPNRRGKGDGPAPFIPLLLPPPPPPPAQFPFPFDATPSSHRVRRLLVPAGEEKPPLPCPNPFPKRTLLGPADEEGGRGRKEEEGPPPDDEVLPLRSSASSFDRFATELRRRKGIILSCVNPVLLSVDKAPNN
mmetsp:Transcript_14559/g.31545  ORF Transcript_14559/g.31545 Transcript_14559/m.31545 type:complete len:210 (-) Transcript_14559:72-701(-)